MARRCRKVVYQRGHYWRARKNRFRVNVNVDTARAFETMNRKVNEDKEMTTENNNPTLSAFVKARRVALGLSANEAARRSGLHRGYWSKLESGAYVAPSPPTLAGIAKGLEVPIEDLYALVGFETPSGLPSLRPYLRARYDLPEAAIAQLEGYFRFLRDQFGIPQDQPVFPPKPKVEERPAAEPDDQEDRRAA
jgi:transcriptional regulator with XRE-family HTH domain